VIGNAFDLAKLSTTVETPLPAASPRIVCIGGLRREKAIDVLLDAMLKVPATLFVIGGDANPSYARACREHATRSGLDGRVVFLGQREDALALATTADFAVHPSRSESGPLVLAEYAALGVPFVATRVGGIAHVLEAADIGTFVDPEDPDALAAAMRDALTSRPPASTKRARELFDIANVMPRWYDVYARAAA
jgi:UDP-glucose:(heptosyl)LPS alpha-1,3-glucosyltransferase